MESATPLEVVVSGWHTSLLYPRSFRGLTTIELQRSGHCSSRRTLDFSLARSSVPSNCDVGGAFPSPPLPCVSVPKESPFSPPVASELTAAPTEMSLGCRFDVAAFPVGFLERSVSVQPSSSSSGRGAVGRGTPSSSCTVDLLWLWSPAPGGAEGGCCCGRATPCNRVLA
eukprot:scaffold1026_cov409-Prasinococcus_capsulatus_cf.AAC.8